MARLVASVAITASLLVAAPAAAAPWDVDRERIIIHGVGDVTFSHNLVWRFSDGDYAVAWSGLGGLFNRSDLAIVNLECTPSRLGRPIPKEWNLRCDPDSLPPMAAAGVGVANLANNHAGDFGPAALVDGVDNVAAAGMRPVGAGADLDAANRPAVLDVGGWRIAVVGMNTVSGNAIGVGSAGTFATPTRPGVAPASLDNIALAVSAAAAQADLVIVTVHWGVQLAPMPTAGDRHRAQAMIEAGADIILGHHPHRLQPLEVIDGVPVFWSLGNFVWPDFGPIQSRTGIAEVIIEPDGSIHARLVPAYIESHGVPVLHGRPDWTLRADRELFR